MINNIGLILYSQNKDYILYIIIFIEYTNAGSEQMYPYEYKRRRM